MFPADRVMAGFVHSSPTESLEPGLGCVAQNLRVRSMETPATADVMAFYSNAHCTHIGREKVRQVGRVVAVTTVNELGGATKGALDM